MSALPAIRRPLALRRRGDLVFAPQTLRGEAVWAVKDPLSLRYFHLREVEHWIIRQLNGDVSLADVQERFAEQFAPARLPLGELQSFLVSLFRSGLVIADTPGQGDELLRRARDQRRTALWRTLANPLAIRFRGIDPAGALDALLRWCGWLLSPASLAVAGALVLAAVLLVLTHLEQFLSRLPERDLFLGPQNLVGLGAALAVVKVLHELGHALACRRLGGECHEIGLLLLVFTPTLYCNVSDSWMLADKWRRAAVAAAGIAVELTLAAAATFLWWFSEPGLFNSLCLNVMAVCSIGTLAINGNPLLRYDGYYVLSDLTESPNLAQDAAAQWQRTAARWVLGIELPAGEPLSGLRSMTLTAYAAAAFFYRLLVLFGVLWFVYKALQPHGLHVLAETLAIIAAAGLVLGPLARFVRFAAHPFWRRQLMTRRAAVGIAATLAAGALLLAVPLPHRVRAPAIVQPAGAIAVYATVPGRLVDGLREGDAVAAGEVIARLENSELALEIEKLRGQRNQQQLRVDTLKRRQVQDRTAAAQLPPALELLADLEQRLRERQVDQERLTLVAPVAGTILPPRRQAARPAPGALPGWSGTPLEPGNRGAALETGTLVCRVGDPSRFEALVVIDQSDVEFVAAGQSVRVQLDQSPGRLLSGRIEELSQIDLEAAPPELLAQRAIVARPDASGIARPVSASYQARVSLLPTEHTLLLGESGRARIDARPLSLAARLLRALGRTFGIELPALKS